MEALRCLRDLGVPSFHHELVRQALMIIFQMPSVKPKMMALLKAVADSGIVPQVSLCLRVDMPGLVAIPTLLQTSGSAVQLISQVVDNLG